MDSCAKDALVFAGDKYCLSAQVDVSVGMEGASKKDPNLPEFKKNLPDIDTYMKGRVRFGLTYHSDVVFSPYVAFVGGVGFLGTGSPKPESDHFSGIMGGEAGFNIAGKLERGPLKAVPRTMGGVFAGIQAEGYEGARAHGTWVTVAEDKGMDLFDSAKLYVGARVFPMNIHTVKAGNSDWIHQFVPGVEGGATYNLNTKEWSGFGALTWAFY